MSTDPDPVGELEQIDREIDCLTRSVQDALERISQLREIRAIAEARQQNQLSGAALAAAALANPRLVDRLRHETRALHPSMIDIRIWNCDLAGDVQAWAPVLLLTHESDPQGIAAAIATWMDRYAHLEQPRITYRSPGYRLAHLKRHTTADKGEPIWIPADDTDPALQPHLHDGPPHASLVELIDSVLNHLALRPPAPS